MEIHILTWVMDVFFVFTLHILAKRVLGMRIENKLIDVIGWCVFFFGWNVLSYLFAEIPLVNGITSLGLILMVICWLYDGTMQNKIIIALAIVILGIISESIVGFIYILFKVNMNDKIDKRNDYVYIGSMISKLINFIFVRVIVIISNKSKQIKIRMTEWAEIFIVPIGSLIIFYVVAWDNDFLITMPEIVTFTILLVINILSYYVYQKMQMQAESMLENELLKQQGEYYKVRYEDAEKQWISLRKMKHDIKNNYVLHMHYLENMQYDKLKEVYEKVLGELICENSIIQTGNIGIDAIVNFKTEMAREMDIVVNSKVEVVGEIRVEHGDMNILLGNLIDNAIEAVVKLPKSERYIDFKIRADLTALLIEIGNTFDGNIEKNHEGKFITSKRSRDDHGLGIKIIEGIVDKYHGLFELSVNNNYFMAKAFLYYLED